MSIKTLIAWTDHTFNIAWGCTKIDPGCAHCYADSFSKRIGLNIWGTTANRRTFGPKHWREPEQWNAIAATEPGVLGEGRPHLVFCSSMCDVFEDHPTIATEREKLWPLIQRTPNLHWQILTKRADRIAANLPACWPEIRSRVWLGVSISEPKGLWRLEHLAKLDSVVRFVSYEPALGDITKNLEFSPSKFDWLIFGGESGPGYRKPDGWQQWARDCRSSCEAHDVPFFFKQSPAPRTEMGIELDGEIVRKFPFVRRSIGIKNNNALSLATR